MAGYFWRVNVNYVKEDGEGDLKGIRIRGTGNVRKGYNS